MSAKIYRPSDFPKPKPDAFREELNAKVALSIERSLFERLDTGIKLEIEDSPTKYSKENLIDFQSHYATSGGWKSVTTVRNKNGFITILMEM